MAFDNYGAPQFGLNDVKIATWNSTGSYGTAVDVPSVQMLNTTLQTVSEILEGDDAETDAASILTAIESTLRYGSVSLAVLEVVLGIASTTDGSTYDNLAAEGGEALPYFGLCGKINSTQGNGDLHMFIPKMKIMSNVDLVNAEYGRHIISNATYRGIKDATYGVFQIVPHASPTAVAIPPTNVRDYS